MPLHASFLVDFGLGLVFFKGISVLPMFFTANQEDAPPVNKIKTEQVPS